MSTGLALPQFDSDPTGRKAQLEKMRQRYAYSLTYDGSIATVNQLPSCEKPGLYYNVKALINLAGLIPSLPGALWKVIKHGLMGQPFKQVKDYIFFGLTPFPNPALREDFWNDLYFGRQCVAGANPVMIQGVNAKNPLPDQFQVKQARLPISAQALDEALTEDRLYMVNYAALKTMKGHLGTVDGHQKHVTTPIALFRLEHDGQLRPLAIQLDVTQDTSAENSIITPDDNQQWRLARTCVQAADAAVHDLWTHAVQIHYVMESIIMVTYRQLGMKHPLLALLDPHLQYTLNVNVHPLYEPGKNGKAPYYGKMFPCDNETLVKFMGEGMRSFKFRQRAFPNDIKNRHMENPKLNYPYRDDGLPVWDAIQTFVEAYIVAYYADDQAVINDYELQAWAKELGSDRASGACGLEDFPTEFSTRKAVAAIFGQIIFTATAHHSAIHFPQYPYAQFVPNLPNALYQSPASLLNADASQQDMMGFFPPFKIALFQSFLYYAVNFKVNRIGEYALELFSPQAAAIIKKHQKALKDISAAHRKKYSQSDMQYPYMDPSHIPNGVTS